MPEGDAHSGQHAWHGTADGGEPGCVDQFNELVYPLAAFPELGPYLESIVDDQRFIDAGQLFETCIVQNAPGTNQRTDSSATTGCSTPLEEVWQTVYREKVSLSWMRILKKSPNTGDGAPEHESESHSTRCNPLGSWWGHDRCRASAGRP
jgi:hypothetical protein